jgi:hypothetical protein
VTGRPEDRRREKWVKPYGKDPFKAKQVRTNPADVANTILKMADKRAYVAMSLLATAASDIFTQDLEDLPQEVAESIEGGGEKKEPIREPEAKKDAPKSNGNLISDAQRKRFYAIWNGAGKTTDEVKAKLVSVIGVADSASIPKDKYDDLCAWAEAKQ